jgi:undecaprenyl-diphosphatase
MLLGLVPALLAREHRPWALRLLGAILGTAALVAGLKAIVGRVRPCNALAWAPAVVASAPHDPSFPSGHAAGSFAFAAFVVMLDRRWGALAVALATLVGLSRIALGVHWPTDVLAGAIVGASIGGWVGRRAATARSAALLGG